MTRTPQKADFYAIFNHLAPAAVEDFNQHGGIEPHLWIVELSDQPGEIDKAMKVDPALTGSLLTGEEAHDTSVVLNALTQPGPLRTAMQAKGINADVVAHITEAWIEGTPDREAVMVMLYSQSDEAAGMCLIKADPRRAEVGKLRDDDFSNRRH